MKESKNAIYDILSEDDTLLAMLAENPPFENPKGSKSAAHSIIPAGYASSITESPFITIQGGPRVKRDPMGHYFDEFIYIRCYNDIEKSFVTIDNILERIQQLLDNKSLTLNNNVSIHLSLETTDMERLDETLNMNYRESSYRSEIVI